MFSASYSRIRPSNLLPLRRYTTADDGAVAHLGARLKKPTRGGQNLSMRYRRMEQSLRGKAALQRDLCSLDSSTTTTAGDLPAVPEPAAKSARFFRGFEIPQQPKAPESDECCMSGCAICVYDLYEKSLAAYEDALAVLRASLSTSNIPPAEWPPEARVEGAAGDRKESTSSPMRSAFEELERALAEKHAREGSTS